MAAVAMAASVFAVDMTAGARLSGDIFTYNGATKEMNAMKIGNENQFWHKPVTLSISSDKAGATVKFTEGDKEAVNAGKWAIWFKPVDALKVDLGTIDDSMNTESIAYGGRVLNYDSFGFRAAYTADALTLKVALVPGKGSYFFANAAVADQANGKKAYDEAYAAYIEANAVDKDNPTAAEKTAAAASAEVAKKAAIDAATGKSAIAELNVAASYNAGDAGTISAMFDAKNAFDEIAVAAGYKNSFGAVTVFADYAFKKAGTNTNVVDFDVIYNEGAINAQAYVRFTAAAANTLYTIAKVNYSLDNGSAVYGRIDIENVLADKFDAKIALGLTGSVGIMSYEVAPTYEIVKKTFSVPFNVAVGF